MLFLSSSLLYFLRDTKSLCVCARSRSRSRSLSRLCLYFSFLVSLLVSLFLCALLCSLCLSLSPYVFSAEMVESYTRIRVIGVYPRISSGRPNKRRQCRLVNSLRETAKKSVRVRATKVGGRFLNFFPSTDSSLHVHIMYHVRLELINPSSPLHLSPGDRENHRVTYARGAVPLSTPRTVAGAPWHAAQSWHAAQFFLLNARPVNYNLTRKYHQGDIARLASPSTSNRIKACVSLLVQPARAPRITGRHAAARRRGISAASAAERRRRPGSSRR